ncbi:MAG: hypothetical protein CL760_09390 [Chloroflexi bacterium]|nr:hypothetical protein [Chloroflexota bacterium]|tara:strand:- start:2328 stop:2762 length:435 start_codon:yes stop_codon:yes gene_type:complete
MPILSIKNQLKIVSFDAEDAVINVAKGDFEVFGAVEEINLVLQGQEFDIESANWEYVYEDDPENASIFSDYCVLAVTDSKDTGYQVVDPYNAIDEVDNYKHCDNFGLFEIPCGNGGCCFIYTAKNDSGEIIAVKVCGVHPEDME